MTKYPVWPEYTAVQRAVDAALVVAVVCLVLVLGYVAARMGAQ